MPQIRCADCGAFKPKEGTHTCPDFSPRDGSRNANWQGGKVSHPLYDTYNAMKYRCQNPNNKQYSDYGGRGITVCDRWLDDFWNFVEDMGSRPDGHVLDRLDNEDGYYPENCAWVTHSESVKNRRYHGYENRKRNNGKFTSEFEEETDAG